jgi:hypothetical protein
MTTPSLLVEGVRSGSRKRNAATVSALVGEGAGPESRRATFTWTYTALYGGRIGFVWALSRPRPETC